MAPVKPMKLKEKLDVEDVFCIACRCIYIRPVTMPCGHTLCMECFNNMVNITSYQCPICRQRISNWLRKSKHNMDLLVNEELWDILQQQYPVEVQKKLNDEDDGLEERIVTQSVTHVPIEEGELKKELDDMKMRYQREQEQLELNNLKLIKQLQEEDVAYHQQAQQARKVSNEELTQNDVDIASAIQEKINNDLIQEEILLKENDTHLAMQLQAQISSKLEEKMKNTKNSSQEKSFLRKGPLDKMFTRLSAKTIENKENTRFASCSLTSSSSFTESPCIPPLSTSLTQSPCTSSSTSYSSSGINSPCTSISTTSDIIVDENFCTCGRLHDIFDSKLPPCKFCSAQITLFDKLMQQKNDFIMAQDLEKKYKMENFEDYNLRKKRSSPFKCVVRKKNLKLSKGQQTLKQVLKENDNKNTIRNKQ